ncbi:WW domain-containing adapter protein with coiled-coil homolog isoform X2 [Anopheles moucheti]|uniref:WW domain-containing adapter protein with coiled-coil homolog isoform X2 n=1 Tax=Anopheles moucheti TaxID=186751 RepID=UPI0022F00445|nr:WW domain-containing adapter protein with coiled-coil homolog isoform X2 [Anopheles moucheti]
MVMHARKPQRLLSDGYHQSHQYQNSKYGSSKRDYERENTSRTTSYSRDRDNSPTGGSLNGNIVPYIVLLIFVCKNFKSHSCFCICCFFLDSPRDRERERDRDRERERERDRDRYQSSGYTMSKLRDKERDREYKKDKYSDCSRSPKRGRSERDIDHRTIHDRRFKMTSSLLDKRGTSSDDRERERERERIERDRERERDRDRLRERERDRGGSGNASTGNAASSNNIGVLGSISATIIAGALNSGNVGSNMLSACANIAAGNTSSNVGGINNSANSVNQSSDRDRVSRVGDWSEHVSSSGKKYYYNCKTEVSQWEKPREWIEKESRVLGKDQQRDYREKEREREKERGGDRERDERYSSAIVNRSSASAYGKHSGSSSSSSSKNNSRGRWQHHESSLSSHRRRTFEDETPDMDISPGDSTPTSEASYSHSSTPTAGLTQVGSQHSQTNHGMVGGNTSTHATTIAVTSSGTPLSSSVVASNNNNISNNNSVLAEGANHNLPVHLPRMVTNSAVSQIGLTNNTQTSLNQQLQHNATPSSNSSSSSSSGASISSPSLHHTAHSSGTSSSALSGIQACPVDAGLLSSNTPGPPSSIAPSLQQNVSHSLTQQQGSTLVQQMPQAQQQPLYSQQLVQSSIQVSSAGSGTSLNVTTSLAGLPKILSQITGNKAIEHNDLNPQKALQTINNALMMQSRQHNPGTVHDMSGNSSTLINLRDHALQSPLYNVSNLSHPVHTTSLSIGSGTLLNHSTHHNHSANSHCSNQSNMMHNIGLVGCSSGNATHTGDGPPTPTQELELPLVDHRKLDGLGSTVVTTTTTSSVSSLQSVMASSQCGRSQGPNLTPSLAKYFRADLISHVTGWPSEILEKTIQKLSEEAHILGDLQCSKVSAELKCARSLVRITEITATLQEQKIMYLRQQIRRLEESKSENSFMSSDDL